MSARVLETVLTGRNLLSPMLATASRDVVAFNSTVATAQGKAAVSATTSAQVQDGAAAKIAASNVKASTSASASASAQMRAHTRAAESATVSARVQETANRSLAASNGLLGTSLTPVTAGLGALGLGLAYAGYRGMEFGSAMSQVQAASQASAADMGRFKDAAIDAGAKTQYSAVEAAQGITEMSKAGVSAKDILGGGLTGALNLAAAGQISVAEAAETGATALSVFRLEGNQMSHVADLLAAGAGKAQGSVGDLSAALNQSALVASQTGLSIEDTAGALAMFASNGLVGSDAGTSFKTMLQALTPNSEAASKAMDAIGFSAYDAQGKFVGMESVAAQLRTGLAGLTEEQRNTTLETIFGSDAVRAASVLYKEGARGVEEWAGKVNDAGYAQRQAAQLTDNLRGDLEKLGGSVDTFFTSLGEGTQGPLRLAVQMLTGLVNIGGDVLGFISSLPAPLTAAVVAFTALTLLNGPLTGLFKGVSFATDVFAASMKNAGGLAGGLKSGMGGLLGSINPVTAALSVAAIGIVQFAQDSAQVEARMDAAADAGDSFRSTLAQQRGVLNEASRAAADMAVEAAGLTDAFDELGISATKAASAMSGNRQDFDEIIADLEEMDQQALWTNDSWNNLFGTNTRMAMDVVSGKATENADAFREAAGAANGYLAIVGNVDAGGWGKQVEAQNAVTEATVAATAATEAATEAQSKLGESLADFVNPLGAYTGLLEEKKEADRLAAEATAADTESSTDSWRDYVHDVGVTFDEYMARLEEQVSAQANWQTNMLQLAGRVSQGTLDELARMGPEGAPLVAELVTRSDAELAQFSGLAEQRSKEASDAWGAQLAAAAPVLAVIGRRAGAGVVAELAAQLQAGTITVAQIAAQYGIQLAGGINPILVALGKNRVSGVNGRVGGLTEADGGVVDFYANGGVRENHVAQIARAGDWRVWAEPETEGEAYIPLAASKRDRSMDIWRETGKRLGAPEAQYFAGGGFASAADVPRPPSTAPYGPPISTAGDAAMDSVYQATAQWIRENGPPGEALAWAKSQVGKPYVWGGVGPAGWDCSGFMSSITNILRGKSPYSRVGATANFPWPGFVPGNGIFTIGSTKDAGGGVGHMAGTLQGVNVESRGGQGVVVGGSARGASNSLFNTRAHLAMYGGGVIDEPVIGIGARTGNSYSLGERGPELVTPASMPGYGSGAAGWGGGIDYDRLAAALSGIAGRRTEITVDATGFNADLIARKVADAQRVEEFLSA